MSEPRIGWTQPLCEPCFQAWNVGQGRPPRKPTHLVGSAEPCLICGAPTGIYVRIDPKLAGLFQNARPREP